MGGHGDGGPSEMQRVKTAPLPSAPTHTHLNTLRMSPGTILPLAATGLEAFSLALMRSWQEGPDPFFERKLLLKGKLC